MNIRHRRVAILSYFSSLEPADLRYLFHFTVQSLLPSAQLLTITHPSSAVTISDMKSSILYMSHVDLSSSWMERVEQMFFTTAARLPLIELPTDHSSDELAMSWERQLGYLHLLEQIIRVVGFRVTTYVPYMTSIVLQLLKYSLHFRKADLGVVNDAVADDPDVGDYDEEKDEDDEEVKSTATSKSRAHRLRSLNQSARVRSLCLLRLSGTTPIPTYLLLTHFI